MNDWYKKYQVNLPEMENGPWKVEKFNVVENDLSQRIEAMKGRRYVPGGTYTRLMKNGHLIMSDTPDEIRDHLRFMRIAKGNILIAGLGLGMVLNWLINKSEVDFITVIEIDKELIDMLTPYYQSDWVYIIHADIFEWKPPKTVYYDYAWYDIWNSICLDNLEEMKRLHRKFERKTTWQGSWCRKELEYLRQQEKNGYWGF